jgi:LPXTG-motif cell wall-anchored protein
MEFEITATDNVEITLGGFIAYKHYKVSVDGNRYRTFFNANATGVTYFNYNSWSTHLFTIEKYVLSTEGGKGEIPGYISMQYDYTDGDELEETGFFWFVFVGLIFLGFILLFVFVRKRKQKD